MSKTWVDFGPSPLEVGTLERGVTILPCERPAAPYQEENTLMVSPLVGWAVRALLYHLWPVVLITVLGDVALMVWRVRAQSRR